MFTEILAASQKNMQQQRYVPPRPTKQTAKPKPVESKHQIKTEALSNPPPRPQPVVRIVKPKPTPTPCPDKEPRRLFVYGDSIPAGCASNIDRLQRVLAEIRVEREARGDKTQPTYADAIKRLLDHYEARQEEGPL